MIRILKVNPKILMHLTLLIFVIYIGKLFPLVGVMLAITYVITVATTLMKQRKAREANPRKEEGKSHESNSNSHR